MSRGDSESGKTEHWENVIYFRQPWPSSAQRHHATRMQLLVHSVSRIPQGYNSQSGGQCVMRSPGSYYSDSDIGNGSGHLCPQCVPVQQEQTVSVTVSPHGKSPPVQPQSASKTQLIISTCMPYLAKPTAGRGFLFQAERKDAEKRLLE